MGGMLVFIFPIFLGWNIWEQTITRSNAVDNSVHQPHRIVLSEQKASADKQLRLQSRTTDKEDASANKKNLAESLSRLNTGPQPRITPRAKKVKVQRAEQKVKKLSTSAAKTLLPPPLFPYWEEVIFTAIPPLLSHEKLSVERPVETRLIKMLQVGGATAAANMPRVTPRAVKVKMGAGEGKNDIAGRLLPVPPFPYWQGIIFSPSVSSMVAPPKLGASAVVMPRITPNAVKRKAIAGQEGEPVNSASLRELLRQRQTALQNSPVEERDKKAGDPTAVEQQFLDAILASSSLDPAILNQLAEIYLGRGEYRPAALIYSFLLGNAQKQDGPEQLVVAVTLLNNLATAEARLDNMEKAECLYQQAVRRIRKESGDTHQLLVGTLTNLAGVQEHQKELAAAAASYQQAIEAAERSFGAEHPDTAVMVTNLANFRRRQGNFGDAEALYRRGLAIKQQSLGTGHSSTLTGIDNLVGLLQERGRYEEAVQFLKKELAGLDLAFGSGNRSSLVLYLRLGGLHEKLGEDEQAKVLYERVLGEQEARLGRGHPDLLLFFAAIARCARRLELYEDALDNYRRVLELEEKKHNPGLRALTLNSSANILGHMRQCEAAAAAYGEALEILRQIHPAGHVNIETVSRSYEAMWHSCTPLQQSTEAKAESQPDSEQ